MIKPVYVNGEVQLYDVYLADGTWLGSKRTWEYAYAYLMWNVTQKRKEHVTLGLS